MITDDIFDIETAKSRGFEAHEIGDTPFISNGFENNGVVGFVKPLGGEKVFSTLGLCISAFCEATVQRPPYLPRGNGGSGLTVLVPKEKMSDEEFYWYAGCINYRRWRFSFGRMVIGGRIRHLKLIKPPDKLKVSINYEKLLPKKIEGKRKIENILFEPYCLKGLFDIVRGRGSYFENCKSGNIPLISASSSNNGIIGFVDMEPAFKAPAITIERVSGTAFVQLEDFVTVPDDIFVLKPKKELSVEEFFYIAAMINRNRWKFNYSRKVTPTRFKKLRIPMSVKDSKSNPDEVIYIVKSVYGWNKVA